MPKTQSPWIIGIDTGGTFTDIVCRHPGGLAVLKVPSTRDDPSRAVVDGVRELLSTLGRDRSGSAQVDVVHGSTVATNTILERRGARIVFITTAGFRDLIEIGRQNRPSLYELEVRRPEPLVPRALRLEVPERIRSDGTVEVGLDRQALVRVLERPGSRVDAVAIGFLFSCRNNLHERMAEKIVREVLPGRPVTISSRISPEIREYERFSTAILNAYVAPQMSDYLERLRRRLPGRSLEIMGSGGGTIPVARARREPVLTVLSGPAAGVLGARDICHRVGVERAITFDMGGTSTDVSLVDGEVCFRCESRIGGLPLRLPVLDVHTVGAGGGSIAHVDAGGSLRVGPRSAGADPGPAVYGKGSSLTVTDVHVFLGHLASDSFLDGTMAIDPARARPLVEELAADLGLTPVHAARGVLRVVDAEMERAIRVVSQERGHDPRRFTLVAFGGASGMHAAALARKLLIPRVLIPPFPGMLCAFGMLCAERIRWRSRTVQSLAERVSPAEVLDIAATLIAEAMKDFRGIPPREVREHLELDLRFQGQTHVVTLAFDATGRGRTRGFDVTDYAGKFLGVYGQKYGFADSSWPVELVAVRVSVRARRRNPPRRKRGRRARPDVKKRPAPCQHRPMVLDGGSRSVRTPIFRREDLHPGHRIRGPALVTEYSGTTIVPEDVRLEVDDQSNVILDLRPGRK